MKNELTNRLIFFAKPDKPSNEGPDFPVSNKKILVGLGRKPKAKVISIEELKKREAESAEKEKREKERRKMADEIAQKTASENDERDKQRLQKLFSEAYKGTKDNLTEIAKIINSDGLDLVTCVQAYKMIKDEIAPFSRALTKYMSNPNRSSDILLVKNDGTEISGSYFLQGKRFNFTTAAMAKVFGLEPEFRILSDNMHSQSYKFFADAMQDMDILEENTLPKLKEDVLNDSEDLPKSSRTLKAYAKQVRNYANTAQELKNLFGATSPLGLKCQEVIAKAQDLDGKNRPIKEIAALINDRINPRPELTENPANKLLGKLRNLKEEPKIAQKPEEE